MADRGWRIIFPNESPESVARKISDLDGLLTSSLHGMVFGDAYGVPTQLLNFSAGNTESTFKYDDYLSVFELKAKPRTVGSVASMTDIEIIGSLRDRTERIAEKLPAVQKDILEAGEALRQLTS
jgi:hypothetical protein